MEVQPIWVGWEI
jgi:SP family myo-inositol transporter-like MFS transporter 13